MKKGLLVTLDFWPRTGGVASYYQGLLENTRAFDISVLVPKMSEKPMSFEPHLHIFRRPFFFKYFWPKWGRLFVELWRLHKKNTFDFFLVGDILPVGTVLLIFSYFIRKPYFVFIHGTDITLATRSFFKTFLAKKILFHAEKIIANSKVTQKRILDLGLQKEKIRVLYPALSSTVVNNVKNLAVKENVIFLTIARLVERKGILFVLSALGTLKKDNILKDFQYVIIGNGPEKEKILQKIQEEDLEKNVILLDHATDEEKWNWLSRASLFLLTSWKPIVSKNRKDYEGFGIVYLEAQAFGLPIIASRTGGISEAVPDGEVGLLVENPENISELSDCIKNLLSDKTLMQKFSENGKIRAKEFTWEIRAKKFEEILNKNLT